MIITKGSVQELLDLVKEADEKQREWRLLLGELFPTGSPVMFALKTGRTISLHTGTVSLHQMAEACDSLVVDVEPSGIPEAWHWQMSNGPCSCCGKTYFTVGLANVKYCLK